MRAFAYAMGAAILLTSNALAEEQHRILQTGDCIDLNGDTYLDYQELRQVLRQFGYTRLGTGGRYGSILVITALGYDKNRYEIKVNGRTGKVVRVQLKRRLY